ncbi:hypothetical protein HAX54_020902 [Datura stramonium]|uniref:Uncharacterized protein n=1 Tax=Datura stramonium TaxID=4076 RepID=A0ABS8S3N7_DATST|nr:hypothetical protein [Datura stramonium]
MSKVAYSSNTSLNSWSVNQVRKKLSGTTIEMSPSDVRTSAGKLLCIERRARDASAVAGASILASLSILWQDPSSLKPTSQIPEEREWTRDSMPASAAGVSLRCAGLSAKEAELLKEGCSAHKISANSEQIPGEPDLPKGNESSSGQATNTNTLIDPLGLEAQPKWRATMYRLWLGHQRIPCSRQIHKEPRIQPRAVKVF